MRTWLRTEFAVPRSLELDDVRLQVIEDITRGTNDELRGLAQDRMDRIHSYTLDRWRSGDFVKAPFGTIGVSKTLWFFSKTAAASGWSIVITLERDRYPDIVSLDQAAADLREARDLAVTEYLREQAGR
jgi:hypothetical protein